MIDNQLAAQLLFNHNLATQEQIMEVWPQVTAEKDVGRLLVEKGILSQQTYGEMIAYLRTLAPAQPETQAPVPESTLAEAAASGSARGPGSSHGELIIESASGPGLAALPDAERDPAIVDIEEENWIPAPDEEPPEARKTSRAEHALRKRMAEQAAAEQQVLDAAEANARLPAAPAGNPLAAAVAAAEAAHDRAAAEKAHTRPSAPARPAEPSHGGPDAGRDPAPKPRLTPETRPRTDGPKVAVPQAVGPDSTWEELLAFARHHEAADLHLSAGNPILLRRYGALQPATQAPMEQSSLRAWVERALTPGQLGEFEAKGDLEFIYTLPHYGRYRVTLLKQRRGWDVTARVIPDRIRSMEEVGLPESCRELTKWAQGLVLVTGPVGCGKSTTLATLVDMVNQERHDHIITIEDPIEILYPPAHCRITQRQIGPHTLSRDAALRAALREDPDIIVISELRDLDTIRLAVSAAETGHLVFGTMNTNNATRTLSRLIDSFPPEEQGIVRNMISESLRGVISQQLLPRKDGSGVLAAFEVLLVNTAVANMIRKDEIHQLGTAMLTGKSSGMVLLDDSLRFLVERGLVDPLEAMSRAINPKDFEKYAGRR
jgi:twitching motility protein PilT